MNISMTAAASQSVCLIPYKRLLYCSLRGKMPKRSKKFACFMYLDILFVIVNKGINTIGRVTLKRGSLKKILLTTQYSNNIDVNHAKATCFAPAS